MTQWAFEHFRISAEIIQVETWVTKFLIDPNKLWLPFWKTLKYFHQKSVLTETLGLPVYTQFHIFCVPESADV